MWVETRCTPMAASTKIDLRSMRNTGVKASSAVLWSGLSQIPSENSQYPARRHSSSGSLLRQRSVRPKRTRAVLSSPCPTSTEKPSTACAAVEKRKRAHAAARPPIFRIIRLHHGTVRLHHAAGFEDRAAQAHHPQEHLAQFFPGRENRRARPERLGQILAAENHGRHRR